MVGFTSKVSGGSFSRFDTRGSGGFNDTGIPRSSTIPGGTFARFDTRGSGGFNDTGIPLTSSNDAFGSAVKDSLRRFIERRDQRIIDLALAPGDENIAQLCWGGLNKNNPRASFGEGATSRNSSEEKKNKPEDDKLFRWSEKERFVVKTKITNPEDKEQYIWVDVCKAMTITSPSQDPFNGKLHLFEFKGKRTQIGVDEGGKSEGGDEENATEKSSGSSTPGPSARTPTGTGTVGTAGTNTGGGAAAP